MAELVYLLERNARLNSATIADSGSGGTVAVQALKWEDSLDGIERPIDVIVGCDVVFKLESIAPLVETIRGLCDSSKTLILLSLEARDPPVHAEFIACVERHFVVRSLPQGKMDASDRDGEVGDPLEFVA
eukprot:Opistho-2@37887